MNPALAEALMTERAKDRQAEACRQRLARLARRGRHRSSADQVPATGSQPGCPPAVLLRSA